MRKIAAILASIFALAPALALAANILPQGVTQFSDNNGAPLAAGKVFFYTAPGSTVLKNTWQDSGQSVLNSNPVQLDIGGRAVIYGSGSYYEVVQDVNGNQIWAGTTQDPAATGPIWAGTSTGSPNAQVVSALGFTNGNGQQVLFQAGFTNTGAMTLNAGTGAIQVVADTSIGPVPLAANSVVLGNVVTAIYDAPNWHILTPAPAAALPPGTLEDYAGQSLPNGFLWADGNCVSSTTYSALFSAIGNTYAQVACPAGQFRLPDGAGRVYAGWNANTGVDGRLTNATMSATGVGGNGGTELVTLSTTQLPAFTPSGTVNLTPGSVTVGQASASSSPNAPTGSTVTFFNQNSNQTFGVTGASATFSGNSIGGGGTTPIVQPTLIVSKIIKY